MMNRACIVALPVGFLTFGPLWAQDEQVYSPSTDAVDITKEIVAQGGLGNLNLSTVEVPVRIFVNDDMVERTGQIILVEPGDRIELRARMDNPTTTAPEGKMTLDDVGFFRQSRHEEIIWMGESDDILIEGADGSVRWRPRGGKGSASYVTAQAARLEVNRTAPLTASPSQPVDVHIFTGKGGVLLLSGVAFDRNGDGMIFGENIGIFPNEKDSQAPGSIQERPEKYIPPATFYRLDERSRRASVTGYTTLGELMPPVFANEDAGKDRYVAISSRLVSFLEAFEENLAEKGLDPEKLSVLRGFVSPNERLRLERLGIKLAKYTRFQYGDGIAVVYDPRLKVEDKGTVPPLMGDVNKDDQVSAEDAQFLADIAKETMDDLGIYGGVGVVANYEGPGPNAGTPYLHIDLRGWYVPFRED